MFTIAVTADVIVVLRFCLTLRHPHIHSHSPGDARSSIFDSHHKAVDIAFTSQLLFFLCSDAVPVRLEHDADDFPCSTGIRVGQHRSWLGTCNLYTAVSGLAQASVAPSPVGVEVVSDFRICIRNDVLGGAAVGPCITVYGHDIHFQPFYLDRNINRC